MASHCSSSSRSRSKSGAAPMTFLRQRLPPTTSTTPANSRGLPTSQRTSCRPPRCVLCPGRGGDAFIRSRVYPALLSLFRSHTVLAPILEPQAHPGAGSALLERHYCAGHQGGQDPADCRARQQHSCHCQVSAQLSRLSAARVIDVACRYQGGEFCVYMTLSVTVQL